MKNNASSVVFVILQHRMENAQTVQFLVLSAQIVRHAQNVRKALYLILISVI